MGPRRLGVVLIAAALAACGDDGENDGAGSTTTQPAPSPVAQDAQAKSDARELATYVEACYVDELDYSRCKDAARGEDIGLATVVSADATTFTIASPSASGNEFRIDRTGAGALRRTCTAPGEAGCPANGRW